MKLTAQERRSLRQAAAVVDAQKELVELEKRRAEGQPMSVGTAGPVFALLFASIVSMVVMYFSVLAITSDRETENAPVFLSGDIEQPLPRG